MNILELSDDLELINYSTGTKPLVLSADKFAAQSRRVKGIKVYNELKKGGLIPFGEDGFEEQAERIRLAGDVAEGRA